MKDSRLSYEIKGAEIAKGMKIDFHSYEELIGGMGSATKMFAVMDDLNERNLLEDSKEYRKMFREIDEISDNIIEQFDERFDGCSTNVVLASFAEAILKIALTKASYQNRKEEEATHKCHADCEIVDTCPKGRALFPNAKSDTRAEAAASKDEPKKKEEPTEINDFKKLQDAISNGDAVATMELVSKMLIKK